MTKEMTDYEKEQIRLKQLELQLRVDWINRQIDIENRRRRDANKSLIDRLFDW